MEQGAFPFPVVNEVPDSLIAACKTAKAALRLSAEISGLQRKEIAFNLGMQEAHLSRILSDMDGSEERHFPENKILQYMKICGNHVYLRWLAIQVGCGLYKLKSQLEMENESKDQEIAKLRNELEIIRKWVKE